MNLNLYDKDLNRIAIIGGQYISCLWSEGYNTVENFSLELIATQEYKKKVRPDCYVGRNDRKTLMVIKSIKISGGKIVATGKQASRVLDDVAFVGTINSGASIDTSLNDAYQKTNKFHNVEIAQGNTGVKYNHQISYKSMLEIYKTICQDTDTGFRVVRNGSKILTELYRPEENPNLIFSEKFGNLTTDEISLSTEPYKNYCIVLGAETENGRVRVDVDATSGKERREFIVDAKDIQKEEGETDEEYAERLTDRGYEKLLETQQIAAVSFTPLAKDFGTRFDLGDILTVYLTDANIKLQSRVARFTQKSQNNLTETTIDVGQITIKRR